MSDHSACGGGLPLYLTTVGECLTLYMLGALWYMATQGQSDHAGLVGTFHVGDNTLEKVLSPWPVWLSG